ncbi:MAG TPA: class I tRNA ligase family protein, partial [Fermentimonas sp.]|nr:class I tRNA ligase family protein [Fermentimonas sp.]
SLKSNNRSVLTQFLICLAPFAPHISEELWHVSGNKNSICDAVWPELNEEYLVEDTFPYSISFNGKSRFVLEFPAEATKEEIEEVVLNHQNSQKWIEGKTPKKVIVVPKKIVNVVL